jgi:hypothetical protein
MYFESIIRLTVKREEIVEPRRPKYWEEASYRGGGEQMSGVFGDRVLYPEERRRRARCSVARLETKIYSPPRSRTGLPRVTGVCSTDIPVKIHRNRNKTDI